MAVGSSILIEYDGDDITGSVLFAESWFECQMAAIPGAFSVTVKDPNRTLDFVTGKELTLTVDGTLLYGGYVFSAQKQYAFPADKTAVLSSVKSRQWLLTGVDYNILFEKRVLHNATDHTHDIPDVTGSPTDGDVIRDHFSDFFDIPSGFDFTDTGRIQDNHTFSRYIWDTQGVKMREVIEDLAQYGSIYYIDASKQLHFVPVQDSLAGWGLSDKPNGHAFSAGDATRGFRDGSMIEDASAIVNDALVWGGSQWAAGGDVVFSRRENATSQTDHGRWQLAENRVGDANYKSSAEVTARAKIIVDGNASGVFTEGSKGLVNPEKQFRATWFAHQVPTDSGVRQHFQPGQVVPIELWVFSEDGGTTPFIMDLPLRQARISFPDLDVASTPSKAWVQIEGFFGVLMSDPYWLWSYLRSIQPSPSRKNADSVISTATNDTVTAVYGAKYSDEPSPAPDGATSVFTIPFAYIATTSRLFVNGLEEIRGVNYDESDPTTGEFTLSFMPVSTDNLWVIATVAG